MRRKIQMALVTVGLLAGLGVSSALAQSGDDKKMSDDKMEGDKMSTDTMPAKKMSHKQMMDKMNAMSSADKAAMIDKMSSQAKADLFDKMPMEKKMAMMKAESAMDSKKMDKMDHDTMEKH